MNPHEEKRIIQWNRELSGDIELLLHLSDDSRSEAFSRYCAEFATLASRVRILGNGAHSERPSIQIAENIRYSAIPEGPELEPFLQVLTMKSDDLTCLPGPIRQQLDRLDKAKEITLFISQQCPHCPVSVRELVPLALANKLITIDIIDGVLFEELAKENNVECLPTTLVGNDFRWSGVTPLADIVEVIASKGSSELSATAIERMLEERNAIKAAQMMIEAGRIHPALFDFMVDERFFLRLGAMAAFEEIIRLDPALATEITQPLWERFEQAIEPMQIDILYLIGDAGTDEAIPLLESVIGGVHREHVKETAREAIESIKARK